MRSKLSILLRQEEMEQGGAGPAEVQGCVPWLQGRVAAAVLQHLFHLDASGPEIQPDPCIVIRVELQHQGYQIMVLKGSFSWQCCRRRQIGQRLKKLGGGE